MKRVFVLLGIAVLIALWTAGSYLVGSFIIPPPWLTLYDTFLMLGRWHTWVQMLTTLFRVTIGFLLAFSVGTALGLFCGRERNVEAFFKPLVLLVQAMPPLLWAIPLILILGAGHFSPILVIALISLPLVAVNVAEGTKSAPRQLEEMLRLYAPGLYPRVRELFLPHLRPFLSSSLKLGIVLSIKASVVAEFFCSNDGIGFQIQAAYQSLQIRRLFAWALFLVLLVILSQCLLSRLIGTGTTKNSTFSKRCVSGSQSVEESPLFFSLPGDTMQEIRLEQVCFAYPSGHKVLHDIDLTVRPGEVIVLSGESGIGKTTLLHLVASLLKPTSGRIVRPERLGLAFQEDRLLPWRTVVWNVALPLVYGGSSVERALTRASVVLKKIGLEGLENSFPSELSGGMKRRVCLSRCFARMSQAILLDEPFSGLHREARQNLYAELYDLLDLHGVPVIIATHLPEEIPFRSNCRYYSLIRIGNGTTQLVPKSPSELFSQRPGKERLDVVTAGSIASHDQRLKIVSSQTHNNYSVEPSL